MIEFDKNTGMYWPANDRNAQQWVVGDSVDIPDMLKIVDEIHPRIKGRSRVMIEAGGHVGYWTKQFAPHFDVIYSFEPDPINFACLAHNVPETWVFKIPFALGREADLIHMVQNEAENSGSKAIRPGHHFMSDRRSFTPVIPLDNLHLPEIHFIQFDLEGYEVPALYGAETLLRKYDPVISVELKGHGQKYGFDEQKSIEFLNDLGYVQKTTIRSDTIFVKQSP